MRPIESPIQRRRSSLTKLEVIRRKLDRIPL